MDEQEITEIKSVLIVEDHNDAAQTLKSVASRAFDDPSIDIAHTFAEGLELLRTKTYSIALLDLGLPDGNGLDLLYYAAKNRRSTLIVVTTIFDDEEHLFDALRSGANGYLLKGQSTIELENYLKEAVAGRPALSPRIAQSMLGYFRTTQSRDSHQKDETFVEQLTGQEKEILSLIAKGCGVIEVGNVLEISPNTVSQHVKNLYSKLNMHNRAEATAAAVQLNIFNPS
jgi:DNA-binding NarL/FixJ family response regulator|tara:strand:- start:219 stop:902 length:684 start_codon:yes stop_codon:yes gene_type:complete